MCVTRLVTILLILELHPANGAQNLSDPSQFPVTFGSNALNNHDIEIKSIDVQPTTILITGTH